MKFGFYTLGCKVNQYETGAMEQLFRALGHEIGSFSEVCDGYIINTCSVTAVADRKNRTVIRRCRKEHPQAVIGVCGCYSQHDPDAAAALQADVIGGSANREEFVHMMIAAVETRQQQRHVDHALSRRNFEVLPAGGMGQRTRAMLKVQDGCVNFCTYCIIPYTRGPVRSAPAELAVVQAQELEKAGYREIVITGIEIASWGMDLPGKPCLSMLVEAICHAVPDLRIRLGSLEPRVITEDFCSCIQKLPNLCPQFHLSMQSGSDSVLKRMHRKYDTDRYLQSINLLRKTFPNCAITTDMIVGFPGETDEEFRQSLAFMERCGFADMHIFPYSRRPGTPADKMSGQLGNATKEARSKEAIALAAKLRQRYIESLAGTVHYVLFEQSEDGYATGHTPNYMKVYVPGQSQHNQVLPVKLVSAFQEGMLGTCVPETGML